MSHATCHMPHATCQVPRATCVVPCQLGSLWIASFNRAVDQALALRIRHVALGDLAKDTLAFDCGHKSRQLPRPFAHTPTRQPPDWMKKPNCMHKFISCHTKHPLCHREQTSKQTKINMKVNMNTHMNECGQNQSQNESESECPLSFHFHICSLDFVVMLYKQFFICNIVAVSTLSKSIEQHFQSSRTQSFSSATTSN